MIRHIRGHSNIWFDLVLKVKYSTILISKFTKFGSVVGPTPGWGMFTPKTPANYGP